jgi:glutaredoxin
MERKTDNFDQLDFLKPSENTYTIYSKSGCPNCKNVKNMLLGKNIAVDIVDCDEYLIETKTEFLQFIMKLTNKEWKTFPMVFDGTHFVGGYADTKEYLEKRLLFNQDF